ncbi:Robofrizzled [Plakobranchus ocellatus]|uniref:Robofrizzled n=1 Tax=Plakobranchus ocellatus TaxID=259542 RepID=A0AAV4CHU7_9GAST|nr:Robofrizzled [Plakobranchus ocellatus]
MDIPESVSCTLILLFVAAASASPLSQVPISTAFSSSSASVSSFSVIDSHLKKTSSPAHCSPVEVTKCSPFYIDAQMPNVFGDYSQTKASKTLRDVLIKLGSTNRLVTSFLCSVFIPPCPSSSKDASKSTMLPLPCRGMCEEALRQSRGALASSPSESWPLRCHTLPTENCFAFDEKSGLRYVKSGLNSKSRRQHKTEVASFASLEVELGPEVEIADNGDDDEFKVEIVSLTSSQIPARRYDIADLGDPELFQGWVDVQGNGAANDYCRVVGKAKRRFLSCNLAGNSGQGHHYVSKLGFDVGHPGTWFMRDMDGDGRDDYCRCVGTKSKSRVTCMKAGQYGFYGSTIQGGDEHTYTMPGSIHCTDRLVNQVFGE